MAYQGEYLVERYGPAAACATPPFATMLAKGLHVSAGTDATRGGIVQLDRLLDERARRTQPSVWTMTADGQWAKRRGTSGSQAMVLGSGGINHRLAEVPMERGRLELVGKTVLYGQPMEMRKFNVLLPTPQTEADWEEMPWLMGQGVGLVNDIRPAGEVVARMMSEAQTILGRLGQSLS